MGGYYKDQELIPESREAKIRDTYIKCSRLEAENKKLKSLLFDIIEDIEIAYNMNNKAVNPNWRSLNEAKDILKNKGDYNG